jgi:hypothetical protein
MSKDKGKEDSNNPQDSPPSKINQSGLNVYFLFIYLSDAEEDKPDCS